MVHLSAVAFVGRRLLIRVVLSQVSLRVLELRHALVAQRTEFAFRFSGQHNAHKTQYTKRPAEGSGMPREKTKTETLSFRVGPGVKAAVRSAAERENRSLANMVEVMVLDYCERHGIEIARRQAGHPPKAR